MFLYEVYGYECHCILVHEKGYTKEEFAQMCKEAPLGGDSEYSLSLIHISEPTRPY